MMGVSGQSIIVANIPCAHPCDLVCCRTVEWGEAKETTGYPIVVAPKICATPKIPSDAIGEFCMTIMIRGEGYDQLIMDG